MIRRLGWLVAGLLTFAVLASALSYFRFDPTTYFAEQRVVFERRQSALYLHITGAVIALGILPVQLSRWVRRRLPRLHRVSGRLYVAGAVAGGVGGLLLSTTAYAGPVARVGFAALGAWWLLTTLVGYAAIRRGDVTTHQRWMIRSASLTFAAVTLRLYIGVATVLRESAGVPLDFATAYAAIAWLSWVPNLALAWWLTRDSGRSPDVPAVTSQHASVGA